MFDPLIDTLDSSWLRICAYVIVAAQAIWWWLRERRGMASHGLDWWPTYWFVSALVLLTMAVARAGAIGDLLAELGRDQARASGWYDSRRSLQALAVIIVAGVWTIGVVVSIWRVPPRRRRYLPHVIALSTVIAFAAIRIVSLHHLDALLYRRDIYGVRLVAVTELTLLGLTLAAAFAIRHTFQTQDAPENEPVEVS